MEDYVEEVSVGLHAQYVEEQQIELAAEIR